MSFRVLKVFVVVFIVSSDTIWYCSCFDFGAAELSRRLCLCESYHFFVPESFLPGFTWANWGRIWVRMLCRVTLLIFRDCWRRICRKIEPRRAVEDNITQFFKHLLDRCLFEMASRLLCEVALDERNMPENWFYIIVVFVGWVDSCHCIFCCKFNVLELCKVGDVEQTSCVMNSYLWLWVSSIKINTPIPELFCVEALNLAFEIRPITFALKRPYVKFEFIWSRRTFSERYKSITILAKKWQVWCLARALWFLPTSTNTAHLSWFEIIIIILFCWSTPSWVFTVGVTIITIFINCIIMSICTSFDWRRPNFSHFSTLYEMMMPFCKPDVDCHVFIGPPFFSKSRTLGVWMKRERCYFFILHILKVFWDYLCHARG